MFPKISAIITTHGRPVLARQAVASVQAERHADLELIVVDDGGDFRAPARSNIALKVVRGRGLGVARARNLGLAKARGEFVIYLDDDDVALPNRIATLAAAAQQHAADLCFGMTRRIVGGDANVLEDVPTHSLSSGAAGFCDLLTCNPHVNAVLVRTETLRAIGGFDVAADHFDDWAAWLRIADRGATIRRVDEAVADWRIHVAGLSGRVLGSGAMKARILSLFHCLEPRLSSENARAITRARELVEASEIRTYDDYVEVMAAARDRFHAIGTCFGRALTWHARAGVA